MLIFRTISLAGIVFEWYFYGESAIEKVIVHALAESRKIDEINVWLGQALASGAHPHRILMVRFPFIYFIK